MQVDDMNRDNRPLKSGRRSLWFHAMCCLALVGTLSATAVVWWRSKTEPHHDAVVGVCEFANALRLGDGRALCAVVDLPRALASRSEIEKGQFLLSSLRNEYPENGVNELAHHRVFCIE